MPNYYATASLAAQSGETADVNVNTFAVICDNDLNSSQAGDWGDAIVDFYTAMNAVGCLRGRSVTGHNLKFLAADGSVPNYPIFESAFALGFTPGGVDMPLEVSLCVSYANDSETGVARARRRGRIYLSGWQEVRNTNGRPDATAYEGLADAYNDYVDAVNLISGLTAGIWSRTNASVYAVERVWCDNEWDTVRSRGGKSTVRYSLTV